ncbi:hypothetical protein HYH03_001264 [Edaphochlamys debaryana]|uniref:Major facilitator superfamily (MFS) profile domain-containing protein n=1 Tax=Edaphochlamys debaryana TaxID=47281 RepID=A0A835YGR3_9CHLO|nr:hypothetical protein HYH03_001264 [Edaphochlamys debaryana]|eukprot:KAG2501487.1 hypothetical protein HYH03_001264 [Edaphochlamys debaryana]
MSTSLMPFMVRDFQTARHGGPPEDADEQAVGRLTGLLAGTLSLSAALTAYAWGCASNHIGRKPVIVIGNAVSLISILWFGLAGSYGSALAARAFGGFFNGILGAWKCMIGESTSVLQQGKLFGYMSLAWGLGCIAGPALGGMFSRPCREGGRMTSLPGCGPGGLFRGRPFLLACLVGSVTILAALLLSVALLEETLPQHLRDSGLQARWRRWMRRRRACCDGDLSADEAMELGECRAAADGSADAMEAKVAAATKGSEAQALLPQGPPASNEDCGGSATCGSDTATDCSPSPSSAQLLAPDDDGEPLLEGGAGSTDTAGSGQAGDSSADAAGAAAKGASGTGGEDRPAAPPQPWWREQQVLLALLAFSSNVLVFGMLEALFPIYATASRAQGGLGMMEEQIAPPLMFFGLVLMPYGLYGYPWLQRRLGTLRLARWGLLTAAAVCLLIPAVASLRAASAAAASVLLYFTTSIHAISLCNTAVGAMIAMNTAPSAEQLGAVNGVGQTLAALLRGVGPALGGVLWAASLGLHAPGQQFLTFALVACGALASWEVFRWLRLPNLK